VLHRRAQFLETVCRVLPHRKGANGTLFLLRRHVLGLLSFFSHGTKEEFIELLFSLHAKPKLAPYELVAIQNEISSKGPSAPSAAVQQRRSARAIPPSPRRTAMPLRRTASSSGGCSHGRLQRCNLHMCCVACACSPTDNTDSLSTKSLIESQRVNRRHAGLELKC
jgi:hypothetical protein